mmetsp:Transcript_38617/g.98788  ORF Transcript_38617/g.98788 Transcript_38617/m.98788 type:complete len:235 (+) Transcript_38617:105-809(+)
MRGFNGFPVVLDNCACRGRRRAVRYSSANHSGLGSRKLRSRKLGWLHHVRGRHHKAEHVAAAGLEARTLAGAPEGGDDVAKVLHDVAVETERVVSHVVHVGFQESGVDDVDVQWLAKRALDVVQVVAQCPFRDNTTAAAGAVLLHAVVVNRQAAAAVRHATLVAPLLALVGAVDEGGVQRVPQLGTKECRVPHVAIDSDDWADGAQRLGARAQKLAQGVLRVEHRNGGDAEAAQ